MSTSDINCIYNNKTINSKCILHMIDSKKIQMAKKTCELFFAI